MDSHADLLKLLLPPVAYDKQGAVLSAEITAESVPLDGFAGVVRAILVEIDAHTSTYLLPDFERVYGLPDECQGEAETIDDRRLRLAAKMAETGGISKSYFLAIAAALGYADATITSFKPMTCESPCDAQLTDESWRFAWRVNVPGLEGPSQCVFNKLSPAESVVMFNYEE